MVNLATLWASTTNNFNYLYIRFFFCDKVYAVRYIYGKHTIPHIQKNIAITSNQSFHLIYILTIISLSHIDIDLCVICVRKLKINIHYRPTKKKKNRLTHIRTASVVAQMRNIRINEFCGNYRIQNDEKKMRPSHAHKITMLQK